MNAIAEAEVVAVVAAHVKPLRCVREPRDQPAIDFNFLAAPGDLDVLVRGFEVARSILAAPAFAPLASWESSPGPQVRERAQIEAHIHARNSNIPVTALAERAADLILGKLP